MVTEAEMSRVVDAYYRSSGYLVNTEVPLLSKRVDIAAYDSAFDTLILVETKVSDWRSALQQASVYTLCTPEVYIAIANEFLHRVDTDRVSKLGLGLLEVDGKVRHILEPSGGYKPQPSVRDSVVRFLRSQGSDCS